MAPHITQLRSRVKSSSDTHLDKSPATSASSVSVGAITPPFTDLWPNLANLSPFSSSSPSGTFFQENYFPSDDYFLGDLTQLSSVEDTSSKSPSYFGKSSSLDPAENPTVSSTSTSAKYCKASSPTSSKVGRRPEIPQNSWGNTSRSSPTSPDPPSTIAEKLRSGRLEKPAQGSYIEDSSVYDSIMDMGLASMNPLEVSTESTGFNEPESKRSRADGRSDALSACWTSPLCPSYSDEGPPPNPATCGGGCAPFLFDNFPPPKQTNDLAIEVSSTDDTNTGVEPRKTLKRSESESSNTPSGRVLSKPTTVNNKKASKQKDLIEESIETNSKSCGRQPHNQVERKYRESINTQLESLRRVIPSLQTPQACADDGDIEDLAVPSKPSKAIILASATAYIKQQEKDKRQLAEDVTLLQQQVKTLRALMKCDDCTLMQYVMDLNLRNGK